MDYKIYKLYFSTGIHIGNGSLENSDFTICSDTIFSSLANEAVLMGEKYLQTFLNIFMEDKLRISDALPFVEDKLYIPKPLLPLEVKDKGNSKDKKAFKKLKYIPIDKIQSYILGDLNPNQEIKKLKNLGAHCVNTQVKIDFSTDSMPYYVGSYKFYDKSGLYIVIQYEDEDNLHFLDKLFNGLSFSGIGGKRSSGLGKFKIDKKDMDKRIKEKFDITDKQIKMSLSSSMAKIDEMDKTLDGAYYLLLKRSGYVYSKTYADTNLKKKDFFVFKSGSCFQNIFNGDIFDVSHYGNHPVYRYAKPMFLGVK